MIYSLTSLKMKWYGHVFSKTLYEYSIALFLFCSLLVFDIFSPLLIARSITDLLGTNLSPLSAALYLLLLNFIFMGLYFCQRKAIFSSEFECYAQSLPISKAAHRLSSFAVLLLSNNFLWVLLLMGAYGALYEQSKVMVVFETVYLVFSLALMQLFWHEKNISKVVVCIVVNLVFIAAKYYQPLPELIFCLTLFIIALACIDLKSITLELDGFRLAKLKLGAVFPLQLAMLRPYSGFLFIKLIMSMGLQAMAALFITHSENPGLIYFILFFNYVAIGIMSSFSRVLALETAKMTSYFRSLPLPKSYWFMKNQMLNLILSLVIVTPGACFALNREAFSIGTLAYLMVAALLINALVYYSNFKQLRNTTLLMFLTALILFTLQLLFR